MQDMSRLTEATVGLNETEINDLDLVDRPVESVADLAVRSAVDMCATNTAVASRTPKDCLKNFECGLQSEFVDQSDPGGNLTAIVFRCANVECKTSEAPNHAVRELKRRVTNITSNLAQARR